MMKQEYKKSCTYIRLFTYAVGSIVLYDKSKWNHVRIPLLSDKLIYD